MGTRSRTLSQRHLLPFMTQPRKHRCDRVIPTVLRRGGADQLHRLVRGRQVFGPMRSTKSAAPLSIAQYAGHFGSPS
ncbi:ATP-dependent bile acid permease [Fusarium oxysporum f. sp. albedinis]|nr:ATP-dependent bile acid permease [Fusarium oxysporum f. sp. albedinis]